MFVFVSKLLVTLGPLPELKHDTVVVGQTGLKICLRIILMFFPQHTAFLIDLP